MKTLTLEVPDEADELDLRMTVACKLFAQGDLSIGQAAKVACVPYRDFMENMGKYGVSPFMHYTVEDLQHDIDVLNQRK